MRGFPLPSQAKILVVDDEAYLCRLCRDALEMDGYEVLTAANGEEALFLLRQETIELVLSDLVMERIDGVELFQQICTEFPQLRKRFVLMTAVVGPEERLASQPNQPMLLLKPFSLATLSGLVRSLLESS